MIGVLSGLVLALLGFAQPEAGPGLQAGATGSVPSHRQADNVAIISIIDGEQISRVTAYSFLRRLRLAEQGGADAIVIELDTPGGEVGAVLEICDAIRSSSISNSVAWVHSSAYSGGALIALACKEIVTSEPARMGDALPIQFGPAGLVNMPEAERQKFTAPLIAEVVASARLRGWDEFVVQGFVALGVELWWVRDTETGQEMAINEEEFRLLFDREPPRARPILESAPRLQAGQAPGAETPAPAPDPATAETPAPETTAQPQSEGFQPAGPDLAAIEVEDVEIGAESRRRTLGESDRGRYELVGYLASGDGPIILDAQAMAMLGFASNLDGARNLRPIRNDADLAAYFGAKNVRRLDASWSEALVRLMTNPITRGILITVFLLAMFLEMSHPGVSLPGAIAVLALIALLAPPALIGLANWWEIGAIFVGIVLILVEVFVLPGFGIPGVVGLLCLFGGLVGTFVGDSPSGLFPGTQAAQQDLMFGLMTILLSTATAVVGMYYLAKHFGSLPVLGGLVLKQVSGQAIESDDPLLGAMATEERFRPQVGQTGRTVTPLRPAGRAQIGDEVFDVVCEIGYVESGRPVRVIASDRFRVVVEETGQADGPAA